MRFSSALLLLVLIPSPSRASCEWDFGVPVGNDCGAVPAEGCCKDGMYRYWCDGGTLCMEECWLADCGYVFLLGYQCGTLMGVGANSCPTIPAPCVPDCVGRQCGDDGCGGSCGNCQGSQTCSNGWCVTPCAPACQGRVCGDDGCGGVCGQCPSGTICQDGTCTSPDCTPDCNGKECGENGCGGTCGSCPEGFRCRDGWCEQMQACRPACEGRECGPDGCFGVCGVCPRGMTCDQTGICREEGGACTPRCEGRECGDDGCGGSCGECEPPGECIVGRCLLPGQDGETQEDDFSQNGGAGGEPIDTGAPVGPQCPAGQWLRYGECVPDPRASTSGGCQSSSGPTASPWPLLLWVAGVALGQRRPRRLGR